MGNNISIIILGILLIIVVELSNKYMWGEYKWQANIEYIQTYNISILI